MRLFDPARHEALGAARWDEGAARRAIQRIARDCEQRFSTERWWPPHPLDTEGARTSEPFTMLYVGAAGVIWALDCLARRGMARPIDRIAQALPEIEERNLRQIAHGRHGVESYLMGRSGVLLTRYRLQPSLDVADRLEQSVASNFDNPSRELLWGAAGTMHAALSMHEWTAETRWAELFRSSASALRAALIDGPSGCRLWNQDLYGRRSTYLGAGHGFAGNAGALIRGLSLFQPPERESWVERIVATTLATALREGALANWSPAWPAYVDPKRLLQWCHGAPGFVTSLARLSDRRLDDVLVAAGELIWTAGPLVKGAGLCHGTAGNGYAFLKLFRRTADERWLDRARAFAMHAIAQSERDAAAYGMRRYSLYTGDPGVALYLMHCIERTDEWPGLDPEAVSFAR
jgi:lantibiotic modifying enzyme